MSVELGVWEGSYQNQTQRWLRWWDSEGNLLLTGSERARLESLHAEQERQRTDAERQRADAQSQRADTERERVDAQRERADAQREQKERLAAYLRAPGIDPDLI